MVGILSDLVGAEKRLADGRGSGMLDPDLGWRRLAFAPALGEVGGVAPEVAPMGGDGVVEGDGAVECGEGISAEVSGGGEGDQDRRNEQANAHGCGLYLSHGSNIR